MNMTSRFFNGTRDGDNYQARVDTIGIPGKRSFDISIVIFNRSTGLPNYAFERIVPDTIGSKRAAVRAVIANPDNF